MILHNWQLGDWRQLQEISWGQIFSKVNNLKGDRRHGLVLVTNYLPGHQLLTCSWSWSCVYKSFGNSSPCPTFGLHMGGSKSKPLNEPEASRVSALFDAMDREIFQSSDGFLNREVGLGPLPSLTSLCMRRSSRASLNGCWTKTQTRRLYVILHIVSKSIRFGMR